MIQLLLHGLKMDPLVSLHYYAPVRRLSSPHTKSPDRVDTGMCHDKPPPPPHDRGLCSILQTGLRGASHSHFERMCRVPPQRGCCLSCRCGERARPYVGWRFQGAHVSRTVLCSVLTKDVQDILLITGSVALFGSIVTPIQIVGYSIALVGLVLFKTSGGK